MGWTTSTHGVAAIRNFADAEKFYEQTDEIRGKPKAEWGVPLQHNRRGIDVKSLHKLHDEQGEVHYSARLYSTDVVVWHRDGTMTLDFSYGSLSTDSVVDHFLWACNAPFGAASGNAQLVASDRGRLAEHLKAQIEDENPPSKIPRRPLFVVDNNSRRIKIKPLDKNLDRATRWDVIGWQRVYGRYVDKSKAYELRKDFKALFDYLKVFKSYPMAEHHKVISEWKDEFYDRWGGRSFGEWLDRAVAADPSDDSLWSAFAAINHVPKHGHWNMPENEKYELKDIKQIKSYLYELAYQQNDLYSNSELPLGHLVRGWRWTKD